MEGKLQKVVEDDKEAIGDIGKVERFVNIAFCACRMIHI
ncbi:hypothetical protein LINPERHAP1_LOCUS21586 [Linum perenne]